MNTRRIVTGLSAAGKSIFIYDGAVPRTIAFQHVPGFVPSLLWETSPGAVVPAPGSHSDPSLTAASFTPAAGATTLQVVVFPPDSIAMSPSFDPVAAGEEYAQHLPGLAEAFERDHPGMHTTDSVDYGVLLEGELWLELDDGASVALKLHDVVVQNGTRHAWRNRSSTPAKMLFVLVGAIRTLESA